MKDMYADSAGGRQHRARIFSMLTVHGIHEEVTSFQPEEDGRSAVTRCVIGITTIRMGSARFEQSRDGDVLCAENT